MHVNELRWRLDELGPVGAMLEHEIHMIQGYYIHESVRDTLMPYFEKAYFNTRGHSDIKDEIKKIERTLFSDYLTI